jgi:hypothetical protein
MNDSNRARWTWALAVGVGLIAVSPAQAAVPNSLSGQLNDTHGASVSNGQVRVYPDGEASLEGGDIASIGTALADASGHFTVSLTPTGRYILSQQAANNDGIANVEITADNGYAMAGVTNVEVPVNSTPAAKKVADASTPITVPMEKEETSISNDHNWACPPPAHTDKDVIRRFVRWVQVGEANMAYSDSNATFNYGRTADSSVTTGYSVGGAVFSVSGSRHIGNSNGASVGKSTNGQGQLKVLSQFLFREGRGRWCDYRTHHHYQRFGIKAKRWIKTVNSEHQHNTLNRCPHILRRSFGPNTNFTRTHNDFEKFHRGVAIDSGFRGWGITFHGGAESGASTHASLHAVFGNQHRHHYACGEGDHTVFNGKRTFSGGS